MRRTGKPKPCVWRWQARFMTEGVDGLPRDKTRPSRVPPLGPEVAERVVAPTLADPPAETTHWTAAMMAKAAGISVSSIRRIWRAHGLQPHRVRQFKLSNDPRFVEKPRDVVGFYLEPPAHAIVLSVDEKRELDTRINLAAFVGMWFTCAGATPGGRFDGSAEFFADCQSSSRR